MKNAAQAFNDNRRERLFPSESRQSEPQPESPPPWQKINHGEMPPMMFQLRFRTGQMVSYTYSDLREVRYRDAGFLQLAVCGVDAILITIEGRHLRELSEFIGLGMIRWVAEADERDDERPETSPSVLKISVEPLRGE